MHPQTLISISTALFLGLMTVVFSGIEAAPVKAKAVPMKSTTPAKRAVAQTAKVNVHAVLKPGAAKTKGKYSLKVTLHNPTAVRTTGFGVRVLLKRRLVGKLEFKKGIGPRARVNRTLRLSLPKQKGQRCVTVKLTKPRGSKLKLGTSQRACVTAMVIRGIGTSPGRKTRAAISRGKRVAPKTKGLVRGRSTKVGKTNTHIRYAVRNVLKVDGKSGVVYVNGHFKLSWDFGTELTDGTTGMHIVMSKGGLSGLNVCQNPDPQSQTPFNNYYEGYRDGNPRGEISINPATANMVAGPLSTYAFQACFWNKNTNQWTGDETNIVNIYYTKPADLVVRNLRLDGSGEFLFDVNNIGPGTKPAKSVPIKYYMTVYDKRNDGTLKLREYQSGNAYYTTQAKLKPGSNIHERTGRRYPSNVRDKIVISVCINQNRAGHSTYSEGYYNNNCGTWRLVNGNTVTSHPGVIQRVSIWQPPAYVGDNYYLKLKGIFLCQELSVDWGEGQAPVKYGPLDFRSAREINLPKTHTTSGLKRLKVNGTNSCTGSAEVSVRIAPAVINGVDVDRSTIPLGQAVRITPKGLGRYCDKLMINWGDGPLFLFPPNQSITHTRLMGKK